MKKIIAISIITASLVAPSVLGQGWMFLITSRSTIWDDFSTPGVPQLDANVEIALLWAANSTPNPMPLGLASAPTSISFESYTDDQAWQDIYPGGTIQSGWTLALDNGDNGDIAGTEIMGPCSMKGSADYDSGLGFDVTGTPAGGSVALLLLSWDDTYATPLAAGNADSAIGWSYVSSFALARSAVDTSIESPDFPREFQVPEPTTLVLAGLGGLSFLLFRKRIANSE
jgi:hypothetical protein